MTRVAATTTGTVSIHRVIEQHAATRGPMPAIVDTDRAMSYRELNCAANATARHLIAHGFRRGSHAIVTMRRGIDLAVTLLAILKAGGSYTWTDPQGGDGAAAPGVSFRTAHAPGDTENTRVDLAPRLAAAVTCSPNLPVVTRGSDVACVLQDGDGAPAVLVPHATITALRARAVPEPTSWFGEPGAFDLWMALMAGTTAIVENEAAVVAAA